MPRRLGAQESQLASSMRGIAFQNTVHDIVDQDDCSRVRKQIQLATD